MVSCFYKLLTTICLCHNVCCALMCVCVMYLLFVGSVYVVTFSTFDCCCIQLRLNLIIAVPILSCTCNEWLRLVLCIFAVELFHSYLLTWCLLYCIVLVVLLVLHEFTFWNYATTDQLLHGLDEMEVVNCISVVVH